MFNLLHKPVILTVKLFKNRQNETENKRRGKDGKSKRRLKFAAWFIKNKVERRQRQEIKWNCNETEDESKAENKEWGRGDERKRMFKWFVSSQSSEQQAQFSHKDNAGWHIKEGRISWTGQNTSSLAHSSQHTLGSLHKLWMIIIAGWVTACDNNISLSRGREEKAQAFR